MHSIRCPQCGLVNFSTAVTCKRCHLAFVGTHAAGPPPPPQYQNSFEGESRGDWAGNDGASSPHVPHINSGYRDVPKQTGLALASMIIGIISFMACGLLFVGSIVGLILGIVAFRKAKRFPIQYGGEAFAIVGIVLSAISFFWIGIIASIAIPNLLASRRAANEGSAISVLRGIHEAEASYQATAGAGRFGTMQELIGSGNIKPWIASDEKNGYTFQIKSDGRTFEALAIPAKDGDRSSRSFYVSAEGVIRGARKGGLPATASDPPLDSDRTLRDREAYQPRSAPPAYSPAY